MVQGSSKIVRKSNTKTKAKIAKQKAKSLQVKKGNPVQLPKNKFRGEAVVDRALSKAIDKSNEQKVAAKLIQDGGRLSLTDVMQKGKELNREKKRKQVKKKLTRVEEKLKTLKEKADKEGLI